MLEAAGEKTLDAGSPPAWRTTTPPDCPWP